MTPKLACGFDVANGWAGPLESVGIDPSHYGVENGRVGVVGCVRSVAFGAVRSGRAVGNVHKSSPVRIR
jgi:hypothetical protein